MKKNSLPSVSAFLLFCLFAIGMAAVLLAGAKLYKTTVQRDQISFDSRTAQQYFATRIRQADGGVAVEPFGDTTALVIPQKIEGKPYITRVYYYDGWLMELFTKASGSFSPEDGEQLLQLEGVDLRLSGSLLSVTVTAGGKSRELLLEVTP